MYACTQYIVRSSGRVCFPYHTRRCRCRRRYLRSHITPFSATPQKEAPGTSENIQDFGNKTPSPQAAQKLVMEVMCAFVRTLPCHVPNY